MRAMVAMPHGLRAPRSVQEGDGGHAAWPAGAQMSACGQVKAVKAGQVTAGHPGVCMKEVEARDSACVRQCV